MPSLSSDPLTTVAFASVVQQDKGESYKMDKLKVRNAVKMVSPGRVAESSTHELPKTIRADQHAPTAQVPDGENLVHYNRCVDRCDLELQRKAVKCEVQKYSRQVEVGEQEVLQQVL